jgi:hypothetical protein
MDLKKFEGSVSRHEFIQGLIMARTETTTPGHIWEKNVYCPNCLFAKQCSNITSALVPKKNPKCRDIINLLLGEIKVEDIK